MTYRSIQITTPGHDGCTESGEAVHLSGEVLSLVWPVPKAPGQPLALHATLSSATMPTATMPTAAVAGDAVAGQEMPAAAHEGLPLLAKTIGSRRREDGRYDVRVRLINLRREARLALEASLA